jgi:hypothetical protein
MSGGLKKTQGSPSRRQVFLNSFLAIKRDCISA